MIFDNKTNISEFDYDSVVKTAKMEVEGEAIFDFSNNVNKLFFFDYFQQLSEHKNDGNDYVFRILIDKTLNSLPDNFDDCVELAFSYLKLDDTAKQLFTSTTPEVISCFLYETLSLLLFDIFCFFHSESKTYKFYKNHYSQYDAYEFLYLLTMEVCKKIKNTDYEITPINLDDIEYELERDENLIFLSIPKNTNEAVTLLMKTIENNSKLYNSIDFYFTQSLEVMTALIYNRIYSIIFYTWYMDHKRSPLRVYFAEKGITNPHHCLYIIIQTFCATLMTKKEVI